MSDEPSAPPKPSALGPMFGPLLFRPAYELTPADEVRACRELLGQATFKWVDGSAAAVWQAWLDRFDAEQR